MLVIVVAVNSLWAAGRSGIWKDSWAVAAKGSDKNYLAIHSSGYLAMKDGRIDEAVGLLERSKRHNSESRFPDRPLLILTQKVPGTVIL